MPIQTKGKKLFFKIELIGYKKSGESIIITVVDENNNIVWCGVIDCFSYRKINRTIIKLNKYEYGDDKRKINFLCITHPDQDHIKDMDYLIEKYTDDNTMFSLPDFFNSKIRQTNEIKSTKNMLERRFNFSTRSDVLNNNIFFNKKMSESQLRWKFIVGTNEYVLQIESLTPADSIIHASRSIKYSQFKNDFSISLKISFNEYTYLLMGDSSEIALNCVDEEDFYGRTNYLKMPHHGDKNNVMEKLIRDNTIEGVEVATCAYRKNTTLNSTLEFYSNNSKYVSSTGSLNIEQNQSMFGVVTHVYDVSTGELQEDMSIKEGNRNIEIF